jgi:peptide-methionine (S)-S-oxide reductase
MTTRFHALSLTLILVLLAGRAATADDRPTPTADRPPAESTAGTDKPAVKSESAAASTEPAKPKPKPGEIQMATFGGGCFWCIEAVFDQVPGVRMAISGYAGGVVPAPSYEMVSSGMTGHAEVVQVVFEPAIIPYEKLLEIFWRIHNPNTPNAQGPDYGTQYRSIILYHSEDQKKAAEKVYKELKARKVLHGVVVTQLLPFQGFFPAEPYHQDYYFNHAADPYSLVYIAPKFDVFRKMGMLPRRKAKRKPSEATKKAPSPVQEERGLPEAGATGDR